MPANTDVSAENELSNIIAWSVVNKLALNLLKTKEIVFHRPHPSKYCLPPPLSGIERVSSVKLLGVHLTDSLSMDEHVRQTISVCNQRLYTLCQLKRRQRLRLPLNCLNLVFDSLIMYRLMYASPSWSGYLNVECVRTIQKLFTKSVKWGVTSKNYQAADIFDVRDEKLFSAMCNWSNHCLHHLLPSERDTGHWTFLSVGLL